MSLLELKLTVLEDSLKKNENRWQSEYIREHWKLEPFLKSLQTKGKMPLAHGVDSFPKEEPLDPCLPYTPPNDKGKK